MSGKRRRGGMLLETMVAVVVLTIGFLAWSGSMMGATQGQYHAQKHTESIEIANYLLEQMRRDPAFWSSEFLWPNSCTQNGSQTNCWGTNAATDACAVTWPAYSDAGPSNGGTWHAGCQNLTWETGASINEPYTFQWRADIHGKGTAAEDDYAADLTVWVETQTLHGGWDTYEVTGLVREPRS
jgi:Tfp pilus assembly protein PilE